MYLVDFSQKHCIRVWMDLGDLDLDRETERCRTSEKDRLDYGKGAINAFKYRGVLPKLLGQKVRSVLSLHDYTFKAYLEVAEGNRRVAQVLWDENRRRINESTDYGIMGFPLDPDSDEVKAFMHYTKQNLVKSCRTLPRWDDWNQVFYESNGGRSDLLPGVDITRALTSLTTNYEEVKALFLQNEKQILEILENGNLVIISNHCTWLNLPLIVAFLHETLEIPLNKINTILGGALTTQQAGFEVANASNLLKTVPDTPNGRLDDVAPNLQNSVHRKFGKTLMKELKNSGGVFIISPGGTSDNISDGRVNLLKASEGTRKLLRGLSKKHHVWPIATNSEELYAKQKIKLGNLRLSESGIIPPNDERRALTMLRESMEMLNSDREVLVHGEDDFVKLS